MSAFYRIVLLLSVAVASVAFVALVAAHRSQREKRSLMDLANEILCVMDSSPLDYMMYGCYCGVGGQGQPRDATDWCCFKHDCCYGGAEEDGCETKTKSYSWDCVDHSTKCDDLTNGSCDERVCECDSNFVKCLNESTYINKYRMWPNFFCNETKPTCDN